MKKPNAAAIPTTALPALLVTLAWSALLVGCGASVETTPGGGSDSTSSGGASGSTGATWPKQIVLVNPEVSSSADGVRFEDGATVAGAGDLRLFVGKVLSIQSPAPESVCAKGTFATLGDVPTETDACPASLSKTWSNYAYLDATWQHTTEESNAAGLGLLLRDKDHEVLYRARVVGDSYDAEGGSTVTIDYEPVP